MMEPGLFGRQLERLMDGHADDSFWLTHLPQMTPCQLGALYVALRMVKRDRQVAKDALHGVVSMLGLSEPWVVSGR